MRHLASNVRRGGLTSSCLCPPFTPPLSIPLFLHLSLTHTLLLYLLQEQLRRRREEEERIAQQNEFLRNSLRGSRKLKALQDTTASIGTPTATPTPSKAQQQQQTQTQQPAMVVGVENEAYLPDEELMQPQVEHIDGELVPPPPPSSLSPL